MRTIILMITLTTLTLTTLHNYTTTRTLQMCEQAQPPLAPINKMMRGDYNEFN